VKKYLSAFVVGFGAGVIQVVPVAKSFACCLIIPAASVIALSLHQKANKYPYPIEFRQAAIIGLLTGIWAALFGTFFDVFITFITKNNDVIASFGQLQKMIASFPFDKTVKKEVTSLLSQIVKEISTTGFSLLYTISVAFNNFIVDSIFGFVGGIIGMRILNMKNENP